MKKYLGLLLASLWIVSALAQENKQAVIHGYGDLYVLYNADESVRIVAAKADGNVMDTTFAYLPDNLKFRYSATGDNTNVSFEFNLHERIKHPWRQQKSDKTLVVSDIHGRLDALIAVLKGNGVINNDLNWSYGKNQLIVLGDILDRGRDDNGIAWLVYKLEKEAEDAGGRLDFIIGNHEDLVLKDDIRYVNEAHLVFSAMAGIPYSDLYGVNTELGYWLRDSYLILTVGDNLFVHAGLSPKIIQKRYKIGEINELGWRFTGYPTKERNNMHTRNETLFGSDGPLWYRGLVTNSEPVSSEDLDKVLDYYKTKRIIVGHSEVDEIDWRYDGRVVAVNVRHYDNFPKNHTAGILIEGNNIYSITYSGKKVLLGK
ncbi:hypothetical protein GGR21_003600 [Dysgonomonas hofstadii]|uniref:Calcineurin-like phosphoesterase domain-containing protein n=1 Tax=Dysgonomonas hofstadii TaxID=637886 RepID=A0A840CSM3_9BACT|nr:metallophosphoesterase [Dysgonomonas hofstadii]MBB4037679.1 hypothetical protein [Dysgonomonas hofstadii]